MRKQAIYAGDPAGIKYLEQAGIPVVSYQNKKLSPEQVLVIGPGGAKLLTPSAKAIAKWNKAGGKILSIGQDQDEINSLSAVKVVMKKEEHISAYFDPAGLNSPFAGIGSADVHNRAPIEIPLVSSGADRLGNGVLAKNDSAGIVYCQLVPWKYDYSKEKHNVKQTFRRASFLLSRLMGNMDIGSTTPLLARFNSPVDAGKPENRWLEGLYLDQPEEWDDPYRFFRW